VKYTVDNCGQAVEAVFSDDDVRVIFLPLLRRLTDLHRAKGGRVLALLAAPPGAGKSTLAAFLRQLSLDTPGICPLTVIGMDGFHHPQRYLDLHTTLRDGVEVPLARVKGAPESFDLEALTRAMKRVAAGEDCLWPVYDRVLHDPMPDALVVTGDLVLLEGNYLLLDEPGWRALASLADYTISIVASLDLLRGRLVARHTDGGKPPEAAKRHVEQSDLRNARLCLERSLPADLRLALADDGTFTVLNGGQ
jgi:pantothenate kinase